MRVCQVDCVAAPTGISVLASTCLHVVHVHVHVPATQYVRDSCYLCLLARRTPTSTGTCTAVHEAVRSVLLIARLKYVYRMLPLHIGAPT